MKTMSVGKLRGLTQIASPRGVLTVCAIDHRGSLERELAEEKPQGVSYQDMVDFKLDLCQVVAPLASAVLLDPLYGAAQAIASGVLPGRTGLLVSAEKTGYAGESTARITELLPDWGAKKIKMMGASAVKLLIYFRADAREVAQKQLDLVNRLADECIKEDLPLLVESVAYPLADEKDHPQEFSKKKPELVMEAASKLTALPIDILKSEFPADIGYEHDEGKLEVYCRQLSQASRLPWVLLSAGIEYGQFKREVEIACKSGASGFMAGRALWQEATRIRDREQRRDFLKTTTIARFKEIAVIAERNARPWYEAFGAKDSRFEGVTEGWYLSYQAPVQ
jgi:tagatose 1,6-diphosphate aldolase